MSVLEATMSAWSDAAVAEEMDDSLAHAVIRAESRARELRNIGDLKEAAHRLADQVDRLGCSRLVAASRIAEPLVTAAALLSDGRISMQLSSDGADKVVLVDAATITGNGARSAAQRLRAEGVSWICVVIYDRVRPDLDCLDSDPLFDQVATLLTD